MGQHEEHDEDPRAKRKTLRVAGEPLYAIGKRRSDRTAALLLALFTAGGGYFEYKARVSEHEDTAQGRAVDMISKDVHDLSERITKLEAVAPSEAAHLSDTLKRIEARLDKIDTRMETKADRRRSW